MTSPLRFATLLHRLNGNAQVSESALAGESYGILSQRLFARTLYVERKRTERSGRGFVLMLLQSDDLLRVQSRDQAVEEILLALSVSSRDTDSIGWFREGASIGVIYTELGEGRDGRSVVEVLRHKVLRELSGTLTVRQMDDVALTFHVFPEDWDKGSPVDDTDVDEVMYNPAPRRFPYLVKRAMDILGSSLALLFCFPLFLLIAAAIKLTSRGPVLFCQQRLGQFGKTFRFLKFRSMYVNNDETVHQKYMARFIADTRDCEQKSQNGSPYKLAADPRVTPVGRFLRRTSLDELPQFLNVLLGEMSLVGPRPPLPYETRCYKMWHRARLLTAKPGITGLWQVTGRSRVKFDEMVRMDLRYATAWSLWLDVKILLQTPRAVLSANGAH